MKLHNLRNVLARLKAITSREATTAAIPVAWDDAVTIIELLEGQQARIIHASGEPLSDNELFARQVRDVAKQFDGTNEAALAALLEAADQLDMTAAPKLSGPLGESK